MGKHAYIIMAHHKFDQLAFLVSCLDHPDNDIFVYIDKSKKITDEEIDKIQKSATLSRVIMVPRTIKVAWGDYSQIAAEQYLFGYAYNYGKYSYFHLLSGMDLPLVSQKKMHDFFDAHDGQNFITRFSQREFIEKNFSRKIRYYYFSTKIPVLSLKPFPKKCWILYRRAEQEFQKLIGVDRLKSFENEGVGDTYYAYANWKSITPKAVEALLADRDFIERHFKHTFCGDELYFPMIMIRANLIDTIYRYDEVKDIPDDLQGNLRYINFWNDWWASNPYVWTDSEEDKAQLDKAIEMGHFFARKFDLDKYPGIRDYVISKIRAEDA